MENISIGLIKYIMLDYDFIADFSKDIQRQWMEDNYIIFNMLYFDNKLPSIGEIIFIPVKRKDRVFLGMAYNNFPFEIKLNFRYHLVEIEWKNVLLHEMIHIWQYVKGYSDSHGKSFKRKASEINKDGWMITTTYKNIIEDIDNYDAYGKYRTN